MKPHPVMDSLRTIGARFLRSQNGYLPALARRLKTDPYTLKHLWWSTGGPEDLSERRDQLLRDIMKERLRDAFEAAVMLAKVQQQSSIWDRDRANRLLDIYAELYPAPPLPDDGVSTQPDMSVQPRSVDELCKAMPPLVAQCFREAMESVE